MNYRIIAFVTAVFLAFFTAVQLVSNDTWFNTLFKRPVDIEIKSFVEDELHKKNDSLDNDGSYASSQFSGNTIEYINYVDVNTVPNVVGLEQHDAIRILEEHGFSFQVYWYQGVQNRPTERYYIASQDKRYAMPGSVIHLELKQL